MYRPVLHCTPRKNWMSDPNGCIYIDGLYHLYFQHNPNSCKWGNIHWGHATSKDLVRWDEQQIVLFPHSDTGLPFSGSAVLDSRNNSGLFPETRNQDNIVFIYTGHIPESLPGKAVQEHQCIAYSVDKGASCLPFHANPVIESQARSDFRDPKVIWHAGTESWVMIVAAAKKLELYRSADLVTWHFSSSFSPELPYSFKNLECPDIIEVPIEGDPETRIWMVSVCIQYEDPAHIADSTIYLVGTFDGYEFTQTEPARRVDQGTEFYAMQSWSNLPYGTCRWIGWVRDWLKDSFFVEHGWRGVMSIARDIRLRRDAHGGHALIQTPCLQAIEDELDNTALTGDLCRNILPHRAYVIDIKRAESTGDAWFHLLLTSRNGDAITIDYNDTRQALLVDKKYADASACRLAHEHRYAQIDRESFNLRIIIDAAVVEVFAGDGSIVFSNSWYTPDEGKSLEVSLSPEILEGFIGETRNNSMVAPRGEQIASNQGKED